MSNEIEYERVLVTLSKPMLEVLDATIVTGSRAGFIEQELRESRLIQETAALLGVKLPITPLERRGSYVRCPESIEEKA